MNMMLILLILCSLNIIAIKVESLDLTLVAEASGADVVRAVISKIQASNSFIQFRSERAIAPFMRRMAYVETRDGTSPAASNGGIWNVDKRLFRRTQHLENNAQIIMRLQENNSQNHIGPVNWSNLTYENLSIPLYSGLAVRILIHLNGTLPLNNQLHPLYWSNVFESGNLSLDQWNDGVAQLSQHEGCQQNIDLVFVLDESSSIGDNNFQTMKSFVYNFTSNLLSDKTVNRIGVITFSTRARVYIALNNTIKVNTLLENIINLPYNRGSTNTASALELMRQQEWRNETSVFRQAIVFTDGRSSNNPATLNAAMEVHDHEPPIVVYALGVGTNIDQDELLEIASGVDLLTNLSSFDENVLDSIRDAYIYQLCFTATQEISLSTSEDGTIGMGITARLQFAAPTNEGMTFRLCLSQGEITIYSSTIPNPSSAQHIWNDTVTANASCLTVFYDISEHHQNRKQIRQNSTESNITLLYITLEGQDEVNRFTFNSSKAFGCNMERIGNIIWPKSHIGQVIQLPCPCEEHFYSGQNASRACSVGNDSLGGQWMAVNYSHCDLDTRDIATLLCSAALVCITAHTDYFNAFRYVYGRSDIQDESIYEPEFRSEVIVNATSQLENFSIYDVSLVIDNLVEDALSNPVVRSNYLRAIDNLQQGDKAAIQESEIQNQSSSRVLESLTRFINELEIESDTSNVSSNITVYQTFAFQLQTIDLSSFQGQVFSINLGSVEEAKNFTRSNDDNAFKISESTTNVFKNATASIYISEELLEQCFDNAKENFTRLSYTVFLSDAFFQTINSSKEIGSIIVRARVNCSGTNTLPVGINATFRFNKNVNASQGKCAYWKTASKDEPGSWVSSGCEKLEVISDNNLDLSLEKRDETSDNIISKGTFQFSKLGYFGVLFDSNPQPLPSVVNVVFEAITYIGVVFSLVCLIILVLTYIIVKKLRTSIHGGILISMSCSLIGLYIVFVICGQVTAIPPLCGISSGLLHYFLLAFFAWTSVEAVWLYLKLVKIFDLQRIESRFLMIASLLSWCVPLLIVATSAAGYRYFTSDYYCRAREWPFWMGLFLPLVLMYIFNWIMFAVILVSVCKHISSSNKCSCLDASNEKLFGRFSVQNFIITLVLSITLGLGWGCGFLATSHDVLPIVIIFQGTFTVVVGIHGVLLFILHGIRNPDARALWKSMLFFVIPRKTSSLQLKSAINTKSTKQASVSNPLSTDSGLSHSMMCEKDCLTVQKIDLVPAMGTEANNGIPSHTINEESEEIVALDSLIQKAEIRDIPIQSQEGFVAVTVKKFDQYSA